MRSGGLPIWRWRACSRPHRSGWRPTHPAVRSPTGSMAPLHDVVEPMKDHVIMTYPNGVAAAGAAQREIGGDRNGAIRSRDDHTGGLERALGHSRARQCRSALPSPQNACSALPLKPVSSARGDLLERTGHPDPVTSRLLLSAADVIESNAAIDAMFRQQLADLLATRLLGCACRYVSHLAADRWAASRQRHCVTPSNACALTAKPTYPSPHWLRMPGLSRFHFCRAFKESTGLSPHAWLRQHRLEQAMTMLRDTEVSVVSIAAALGYASQTAFAAAFRKLTGETPSDWRRRMR